MSENQMIASFNEKGYALIENAIPEAELDSLRDEYEKLIARAIQQGYAEKNEENGYIVGHRFQDPHHPSLKPGAFSRTLCPTKVHEFCSDLFETTDYLFYGSAAFSMKEDYHYVGNYHRDSTGLWTEDLFKKLMNRPVLKSVQIMLPLLDDACFNIVPGSHVRPNLPEEDEILSGRADGDVPGMQQVSVKAGTAVAFDFRAIHRGYKDPGLQRRAIFYVYGIRENFDYHWRLLRKTSQDQSYREKEYLDSLEPKFRNALENTLNEYLHKNPEDLENLYLQ